MSILLRTLGLPSHEPSAEDFDLHQRESASPLYLKSSFRLYTTKSPEKVLELLKVHIQPYKVIKPWQTTGFALRHKRYSGRLEDRTLVIARRAFGHTRNYHYPWLRLRLLETEDGGTELVLDAQSNPGAGEEHAKALRRFVALSLLMLLVFPIIEICIEAFRFDFQSVLALMVRDLLLIFVGYVIFKGFRGLNAFHFDLNVNDDLEFLKSLLSAEASD